MRKPQTTHRSLIAGAGANLAGGCTQFLNVSTGSDTKSYILVGVQSNRIQKRDWYAVECIREIKKMETTIGGFIGHTEVEYGLPVIPKNPEIFPVNRDENGFYVTRPVVLTALHKDGFVNEQELLSFIEKNGAELDEKSGMVFVYSRTKKGNVQHTKKRLGLPSSVCAYKYDYNF
jgi:hypothetical protein